MRKPDKLNMLQSRLVGHTDATLPSDVFNVVDGGCLLHNVRWFRNQTFGQVLQHYIL